MPFANRLLEVGSESRHALGVWVERLRRASLKSVAPQKAFGLARVVDISITRDINSVRATVLAERGGVEHGHVRVSECARRMIHEVMPEDAGAVRESLRTVGGTRVEQDSRRLEC